jgi:signal transduction histidine kinase
LTWWLGDVGGALVVAPLLLLWATREAELRPTASTGELLVLGVAVAATALVVFTPWSALAAANAPIGFLVFPILVWPVVRFGPRVAATVTATLAVIAVVGSTQGAGPWVRADPTISFLLLAAFLAVAALTSLLVGAGVLERQRFAEALRATEERLRVAEERKVAARDEFLSIAAHELRTPITSLRLATQYLLREVDAGRPVPEQSLRTAAEALMSQTKRLGELIGQLLDTARIQADRMDLQLAEQDVAEIARRIAREAQMMTARHEIDVVADGPVTAAVDEIRIEQVLRNLLDNAIKYSPGGEIAVGLLPEDGAWVQLSVSDHGPGIPVGARDRIFDRFYQARKEDKGGGGLGLGLHVSRRIVELHGGTIRADFPADGGTRIIVRLPAKGPVEGAVR